MVDPGANDFFVLFVNKVKEAAGGDFGGGDEKVVGAVEDGAFGGETVEYEEGAEGLIGKVGKVKGILAAELDGRGAGVGGGVGARVAWGMGACACIA